MLIDWKVVVRWSLLQGVRPELCSVCSRIAPSQEFHHRRCTRWWNANHPRTVRYQLCRSRLIYDDTIIIQRLHSRSTINRCLCSLSIFIKAETKMKFESRLADLLKMRQSHFFTFKISLNFIFLAESKLNSSIKKITNTKESITIQPPKNWKKHK